MEGEPARAALARDYPGWEIWRRDRLAYAWYVRSSPPVLLRDADLDGLRRRLEVFTSVLARLGGPNVTGAISAARAAAEALET